MPSSVLVLKMGGSITQWARQAADGERDDRRPGLVAGGDRLLADARAFLSEPDLALMEAIYGEGLSAIRTGALLGLSERAVRWRSDRLLARLTSPLFRFVARHREAWPDFRRAVAEAVILRGEPQAATAARLGATFHRVRSEVAHVRAMCEAALADQR